MGSLEAAFGGQVQGKTLIIHGCGNVGAVVAAEMVRQGATVYTVDMDPARAEIEGCINISEGSENARADWWTIQCDAIVPCSKSGLFTTQVRTCQLLVAIQARTTYRIIIK